ncbi:GntR family transcriptional regulator [Devosia rhodophyticola]|uniref:GntR family transcriptional regulator n=1 Tax=Devosia rhodophyticola TaxID=3026423 RepID=A0ABY7YZH7_9HYPH|nr:GntR family transcriptional regulator [Devosia rhodophyticola]WDR06478.1 GntR family transcriptional regulator [Devosia rhodophyticola]
MIDKLSLRASNLGASASSSDVIHDALRAAIIRGEIEEGQTLRQDAIAKMFNVSRIPVREALKRLEASGLVTSVRYKGVVVSPISVAEIEEIFEFRATIEPQLIAHSVPRMTTESLDHAQALCNSFAQEKEAGLWGDLNRQFHSSLYLNAQRPYYFAAAAAANDRVERYIRAQLSLTHGRDRAIEEHQMIVDACCKGDAQRAAALTRDHIMQASTSLTKFLDRGD